MIIMMINEHDYPLNTKIHMMKIREKWWGITDGHTFL